MKAWLFDVDGVITNPVEKIANPKILDFLIKKMESGDIVGLNTGRSLRFIVDEILKPLERKIEDKNLLNKLFSVGEKGGIWAKYVNGAINEEVDKSMTVPRNLQKDVKKLLEEKFPETMFFDNTKQTMISVEFEKGKDFNEFQEEQKLLNEELKKLLVKHNLVDLKIDASTIATDIQNPSAGKDLGVKRFLEMLDREPDEFETFGDSSSDIEMYNYLIQKGHKAIFVYVGNKTIDRENEGIIKTREHFDKGTLEYLQTH